MTEGLTPQQEELISDIAERFGIDVPFSRRNGDRIMFAALEQVYHLRKAFDGHLVEEAKRTEVSIQIRTAAACLMAGMAFVSWESVGPAMGSVIRVLLCALPGITDDQCTMLNTIRVAWPIEILHLVGGMLMLAGIVGAFFPKLLAPLIGRLFRPK